MAKKVKAKAKVTVKRKKRVIKRKRVLKTASSDAGRLVTEMRGYHEQLAAKCASLQSEMQAVATAIEAMGAAVTTKTVRRAPAKASAVRRGPRPTGKSLKDYISQVLSSVARPMSVKDLSKRVVRSGYKTKSKSLGNQISMALAQMSKKKQVRKVSRGMYRA